jgi:Brp/Blh family beta-carotene 15,15'-monooxygenase
MTGIPHGAIDPMLLTQPAGKPRYAAVVRFMLNYLLQVAAVLMLSWLSPGLALALFLLMSAWHFGGDWRQRLAGHARLLAGLAVVLAPLLFHPEQTTALFVLIAGDAGQAIASVGYWLAMPACFGLAAFALLPKPGRPNDRLDWAMLILLAWLAPPLIYFAVYFCALHSLRHLLDAKHHSPGRHRLWWWVSGLGLSLATLIGAWCLASYLSDAADSQRWLQTIFIGLSALTVPHMALMEQVHQRWKRQTQVGRGRALEKTRGYF